MREVVLGCCCKKIPGAMIPGAVSSEPQFNLTPANWKSCSALYLVRKELQGNMATELEVFGFVDDTHPAPADFAKDAVMGNRLPHGLGGVATGLTG
jgi:hypothetical protein